jgi:hypothetical protein
MAKQPGYVQGLKKDRLLVFGNAALSQAPEDEPTIEAEAIPFKPESH